MSDGLGFWWQDVYWLSLTTAESSPGVQQDAYFGPVGADTHGHQWLRVNTGAPNTSGAQLKDRGTHIGSGATFDGLPAVPAFRGRAEWDPQAQVITTQIAEVCHSSVYSAGPVTSARTQSSRSPQRVDVALPSGAQWFEFEVSLQPWGSTSSPADRPEYRTPFGPTSELAIVLSVTSWGPRYTAA